MTDVRPMRLGDADAVAALCAQLGYPTAAREIRDRFEVIHGDSDHALLVACCSRLSESEVIGWVHVYGRRLVEVEPHAEIGGLVVGDAHRGQGVGRALMAEAEQWAIAHGYTEVVLRSRADRSPAHRFYERIGYTRVSSQHKFQKRLLAPSPGAGEGAV